MAASIYDELFKVGIFHRTPEAAANVVNSVWDNVEEWWFEPERQAAADRYRHNFARCSDHSAKEWKELLMDLLNEN